MKFATKRIWNCPPHL